jgi:hypothetical protein
MGFRYAHPWRMRLGRPAIVLLTVVGMAEAWSAPSAAARVPPEPRALVLSVRANPSALHQWGGTVAVSGRVRNATSCQLVLLSHQGFPVIYSHNPTGACRGGNYSAHVTIGANPTYVQRLITFVLVARNARSSFRGWFYILLAPHVTHRSVPATVPRPTTTSTVPTTTTTTTVPRPVATTAPPAPVTSPLSTASAATQIASRNWSGYVVTAGPFTEVTGTFSVPRLTASASCDQHISEWVGIGGFNSGDTSLIQGGIDESMTDPTTGTCRPGSFFVWPWWEVLPQSETQVTRWDDGTAAQVGPGDRVTVTVAQASGSAWGITITDRPSKGPAETFTTMRPYAGPASSAEWVVEAPTSPSGQLFNLAPFDPAVTFSGLGVAGNQAAVWEDQMGQGGLVVATPSSLVSNGFSVTYTGSG